MPAAPKHAGDRAVCGEDLFSPIGALARAGLASPTGERMEKGRVWMNDDERAPTPAAKMVPIVGRIDADGLVTITDPAWRPRPQLHLVQDDEVPAGS